MIELIFTLTGAGFISYVLLSILYNCVNVFKAYLNKINPPDFVSKYGQWAVITGSSDGIGLQYARQLARRGMNVVLMSYVEEQLLDAAKQIEIDFKVKTKTIVVDFSDGLHIFEEIGKQLKGLDIGILMNNVGVSLPYPMSTIEMTEKQIWDHVSINILAGTMMTKLLLPEMKIRKRGAIVNVASSAAMNPAPYLNIYSAGKVYVDYMSRGLNFECKGSGVKVQTLVPGFIRTNMIGNSKILRSKGILVPEVTTFVEHAVNTLGAIDHTTGYMPHGIQHWILSSVPAFLYIPGAAVFYKSLRADYEEIVASSK